MKVSDLAYNNAILNLSECRDRKLILRSYPLKIYIEPTSACNLKCSYCHPPELHHSKGLGIDTFKALEKQLFNHVCEVNVFLSGEPVLHNKFAEMLEICGKYPFVTKFFSNLSYKNDNILKKMVETGSWVNVSFDGIEGNVLRDGCDTELIIENIKKLKEYQKSVKNSRFHLRIATVVGKHNVHTLRSLIDWCAQMEISEIMLGCLDAPEKLKHFELTCDDAEYFNQAVSRADLYGIRISTPSHIGGCKLSKPSNWDDFNLPIDKYFPHFCEDCNPDVENKFCPYPWIQTVIESNGDVISCCQRKIKLGKFTPDTDFIGDIWNNEAYQKIRSVGDYTLCKPEDGGFCNMVKYSIWGGELRLNKIPGMQ